jgi:hypothetical protein
MSHNRALYRNNRCEGAYNPFGSTAHPDAIQNSSVGASQLLPDVDENTYLARILVEEINNEALLQELTNAVLKEALNPSVAKIPLPKNFSSNPALLFAHSQEQSRSGALHRLPSEPKNISTADRQGPRTHGKG